MQQSRINRQIVGEVFRMMRGRFGSAFIAKFQTGERVPAGKPFEGYDIGVLEAIDIWVDVLKDLIPADIKHGLSQTFKHPPSADEFLAACCTREITPPVPIPGQKRLQAPPRLSAEEAAVKIASVAKAAKGMRFPNDLGQRIGWAETIAAEVSRGVYKGGTAGAQMAAEALLQARKLPGHMVKFLPKVKTENSESSDSEEAAA